MSTSSASDVVRPTGRRRDGPEGSRGLALVVIATAQLMVVLDATIVNVALPRIQRALGFGGSGLEWVVNGYALTFGGLLLLGGRAGDLLGRRRVLIAGLLLFSTASALGGFATTQAWLLAARAGQGVGGALIAPTTLALITTTFPEGPPRNRALGVYAAMSGGGAAIGLVAGGLLTTYLSWRWVLFVNVPIGLATAAAASVAFGESMRVRGRLDLPGAITATAGVTLAVFALSHAGTDQAGVSHWTDPAVVGPLIAATVLLVAFAMIEARTADALMPPRIVADRVRGGAVLVMLLVSTAMFGFFFFVALFAQIVLGYSPLGSGVAFLPFTVTLVVFSAVSGRLVGRTGPGPMMLVGTAVAAGGMAWFSRIDVRTTYLPGLIGPMLVTATGLGLLFVPLSRTALYRIRVEDSGLAASVLNTAQQVGGAVGLAALGSVAWTTVATRMRTTATYPQALADGVTRGFLVASGFALAAFIVVAVTIRIPRAGPTTSTPTQPTTARHVEGA